MADINVQNEGNIFLLHPQSEAGQQWIDENIGTGEGTTYFGNALVVEHRYVANVVEGMQADGLLVS